MAERASRDRVAADMQPPNWRAAVQLIRISIEKKKAKVAEVNSAIGDDWAKVEGYKVNKKAGRIFGMLDKLENEERVEIMRSLNGLIDAAGWDKEAADLVDEAEGNVVHLRVGGSSETGGAKEDDDEREGEDEGGEAEMAEVKAAIAAPAKSGRKPKASAAEDVKNRANEAKAKVAEQILGKPSVSNVTPPETYTGDNSDLAGE